MRIEAQETLLVERRAMHSDAVSAGGTHGEVECG